MAPANCLSLLYSNKLICKMNAASTNAPTLDDVVGFNDTLLSIHEAGVPIGLGTDSEAGQLGEQLSAINARIAMSIARGSTVRQVLDSDGELPLLYRSALRTWLYCDHSPDALKALSEAGRSRRTLDRILGYSILQPLILFVLAYFGFLYLLVAITPMMQSISVQIGEMPGVGLRFLFAAREYVWPLAVSGPAVIALGLVVWRNRGWKSCESWFPGQRYISESIRKANFADTVSNLLKHDGSAGQDFARGESLGSNKEGDGNKTEPTPLLHWALNNELNREDKIDALHFAARGYRAILAKRTGRLRSWFPVVVGSLVGGAIVLFYGLCLFGPLIELLSALARP